MTVARFPDEATRARDRGSPPIWPLTRWRRSLRARPSGGLHKNIHLLVLRTVETPP